MADNRIIHIDWEQVRNTKYTHEPDRAFGYLVLACDRVLRETYDDYSFITTDEYSVFAINLGERDNEHNFSCKVKLKEKEDGKRTYKTQKRNHKKNHWIYSFLTNSIYCCYGYIKC